MEDKLSPSCVVIKTKASDIAVFGVELVGEQELNNIVKVLNFLGDHEVRMIVFRRDTPEKIMANCSFDSGAVTINVAHTLNKTFDRVYEIATAAENAVDISIMMLFWHNMYVNYIHEALHLAEPKKKEKTITREANKLVYDIERDCGFTTNMNGSFFINRHIEGMLGMESEFYDRQKAMLKDGVILKDANGPILNPRKYFQLFAGAEADDARWLTVPAIIPMSMAEYVKEAVTTAPLNIPEPVVIAEPIIVNNAMTMSVGGGFTQSNNSFDNGGFDDVNDYCPEDDGFTSPEKEFVPTQTMSAYVAAQPAPVMVQHQSAIVTNIATNPQTIIKQLPTTGLSNAQTAEIVLGICSKIFNHIFTTCQPILNSDTGWANVNAAYTPIPLTDTEKMVLVGMNTFENGRWVKKDSATGVVGYVAKNTLIPMYKLYFNCNGVEMIRTVLPQNPSKRDPSGTLSKQAQMARAGIKILYINEGNDAIAMATGKKYRYKAVVEPGQQLTAWLKC